MYCVTVVTSLNTHEVKCLCTIWSLVMHNKITDHWFIRASKVHQVVHSLRVSN